jgi:hypothetical protein
MTASTLGKTAIVAGALALAVWLGPHGGVSRPAPREVSADDPRVDATSDAEARQLRGATQSLAAELSAAARCGTGRFAACVAPALRRGSIGGRTTAMLARVVMADVPVGPCRTYLFGLQAANDAAGDEARWLLPLLYGPGRRRHQHEITRRLPLAGVMLRRAARAGAGGCTPRGAAGANSFRLTGRLIARPLAGGSYRPVATPSADRLRGEAKRARFRIEG